MVEPQMNVQPRGHDATEIEIVSIATDTYPLDGLLYSPRNGPILGAAMLLHGNCHNFYMGPSRFLPPVLTAAGFACLAYNRRGHDMVTSLHGREIGGGSFQLAREALEDNRLASAWLRSRGFAAPILIGHSNGGVLAVQHCVDHPDTPALVLMSAHRGGRGITDVLGRYGLFGKDQLEKLKQQAERMVAEGRGSDLMLLPGWWWVVSAESLLDYGEAMPDLLANAERVRCPTLYLRGDKEPEELYPAEAFVRRCSGAEVRILSDCDHFYTGHEDAVAAMIADWLKRQTIDRPSGTE
jgi:pimeloyl-ACP methyl ester carboxylesterase